MQLDIPQLRQSILTIDVDNRSLTNIELPNNVHDIVTLGEYKYELPLFDLVLGQTF